MGWVEPHIKLFVYCRFRVHALIVWVSFASVSKSTHPCFPHAVQWCNSQICGDLCCPRGNLCRIDSVGNPHCCKPEGGDRCPCSPTPDEICPTNSECCVGWRMKNDDPYTSEFVINSGHCELGHVIYSPNDPAFNPACYCPAPSIACGIDPIRCCWPSLDESCCVDNRGAVPAAFHCMTPGSTCCGGSVCPQGNTPKHCDTYPLCCSAEVPYCEPCDDCRLPVSCSAYVCT